MPGIVSVLRTAALAQRALGDALEALAEELEREHQRLVGLDAACRQHGRCLAFYPRRTVR